MSEEKTNAWGYDFHRQKPIHNFICDFYCFKLNLCIEVDGGYHNQPEQIEKDKRREEALNEIRIHVLRFSSTAVLKNIQQVLYEIENYIDRKESEN